MDKSIRIDSIWDVNITRGTVTYRAVFNNLFAYLLTFVDHLQYLDASFARRCTPEDD